jgi:hypothetical protein
MLEGVESSCWLFEESQLGPHCISVARRLTGTSGDHVASIPLVAFLFLCSSYLELLLIICHTLVNMLFKKTISS